MECRHLSLGAVKTFYVERLKLFRGSREDALRLASSDANQYEVDRFLAFRGDPLTRTTVHFLVRFGDGEELWLPWSLDLFNTVQYEEYCSGIPCLRPLVHSAKESLAWCARLRKTDITAISPETVVFLDLRAFGAHWYQTLPLPDLHTHTYCVEAVYARWVRGKRLVELRVPLFDLLKEVDHVFVALYGSATSLPTGATLLNPLLVAKYPEVRPTTIKASPLSSFKHLVGKSFRDDEDGRVYVVTRVVIDKNDYIVAYVRPLTARGRPSKELEAPIHAADVAKLVAEFTQKEGGEGGTVT